MNDEIKIGVYVKKNPSTNNQKQKTNSKENTHEKIEFIDKTAHKAFIENIFSIKSYS